MRLTGTINALSADVRSIYRLGDGRVMRAFKPGCSFQTAIRNETTGLTGGGPHPSAARQEGQQWPATTPDVSDTNPPIVRNCARAPTSWRALANVTVASTLVVAVVVSVLSLLEAVFSTSTSRLARHAPTSFGIAELARACATARAFLTDSSAGRACAVRAD